MDLDAQGFVDGLKGCFADLEDPRNEKSCAHRLFDVVAIAVLSVACGADDWCDRATFARVRLDWLKGLERRKTSSILWASHQRPQERRRCDPPPRWSPSSST